jgi:hypothetical protein
MLAYCGGGGVVGRVRARRHETSLKDGGGTALDPVRGPIFGHVYFSRPECSILEPRLAVQ